MTGLALAFAASIAWASLDATRKALVRDVDPVAAAALLALLVAPVFLVWAFVAGGHGPSVDYWAPGGAALVLQVVANVLFFRALAVSPLSLTIPLLSLTPVFTSLLGFAVLGEQLTASQCAGIALVVLGALALHGGGVRALAALRSERGSLLMVAVALLWSASAPLNKLALQHASVPWHATIQTSGVGVALLVLLLVRGGLPRLRVVAGARRWLAASALFSLAALSFEFLAIRTVFVGLVEALKRGIGMTSSVLVGRAAFGEPVTAGKAIAVVLMTGGIVLVLV